MNNDNDNDDERIAMMETKINNNNNNNNNNGNETKQQKQEAVPSSSSSSSFNNNKKEKFIGITILITAQIACASTATCVHALPIETPSVLRGLWRQTLTSIIFAIFSFIVWIFHFQQQQRQSQSSSSSTLTLTSSRNNNNIGSYNNNSYYANNGGGDTNNNSINNSKKNSITNLSSESLLSVGEQEALLQTVERINSTNNSNNNSYKDDNPSLNNDHDHYRQQQQQQQEKEGLIATTTTTNKTTTDTSTATATDSTNDNDNNNDNQTTTRLFYIILAVIGATLLNDTMVVALKYASSAAVMCLVNTTPIWLILYAIIICRPPSSITIAGATLSLIGAMICAMGGGGSSSSSNGDVGSGVERGGQEELGSIIAMAGGVGGAMYMTACRKLSPLGLHPVYLTLMINVGMMLSSLLLCLVTIDDSLEMMSTNTNNGFWGFLNSNSNPAATLQSIFPDCLGCFGIMIALGFFDPLIVSMVMLTEPLNASLIAMAVVHEPPPSNKTVLGVSIVLLGCALVLWETSKAGRKASELEKQIDNVSSSSGEYDVDEAVPPPPSALTREESKQLQKSYEQQRRTSNVLLLSTIKTIAPGITVKAAGWKRQPLIRPARIMSLAPKHYRHFGLSGDARRAATATGEQTSLLRPLGQQQQQQQDSDISSSSRRSTMPSIAVFQSLRSSLVKYARESSRYIYGSFEEDDDNEDYNVI